MKNFILIGLLTLLVSTANAERSVPVMVGGTTSSYACKGTGKVVGLKSNGDGFLAVRNGPGRNYTMINKIYNNNEVLFCDQEKEWIGIVYGENCGLNRNLAKRQSYTGQCKSGWVYNKFVQIQNLFSNNTYNSNPVQVSSADISAIKIRVNSIVKQIENCVYLTPERTALGISRTKSRMSDKDGKIFESMANDRIKYITYCDNSESSDTENTSNSYNSMPQKDKIEYDKEKTNYKQDAEYDKEKSEVESNTNYDEERFAIQEKKESSNFLFIIPIVLIIVILIIVIYKKKKVLDEIENKKAINNIKGILEQHPSLVLERGEVKLIIKRVRDIMDYFYTFDNSLFSDNQILQAIEELTQGNNWGILKISKPEKNPFE